MAMSVRLFACACANVGLRVCLLVCHLRWCHFACRTWSSLAPGGAVPPSPAVSGMHHMTDGSMQGAVLLWEIPSGCRPTPPSTP
eukprot:3751677-Amphidinium_carterae.2